MPRRQLPPELMSQKPEQMRRRIRRKAGKAEEEVEYYIKTIYKKPVEEWDWEELAHGRPRDKNGFMTGARPQWTGAHIVREARRRLIEGVYGDLGHSAKYALEVLRRLVTSNDVDDKVALDAAKYIIDHIIGKPKALVEIDASEKVRNFLARAIVLDDGKPQHEVIDGQYRTDSDEGDDDDD